MINELKKSQIIHKSNPIEQNIHERKMIMKDRNELLEYIYQTAEMGKTSLNTLLKALEGKDNKIKTIVEKQKEEYEEFYKESEKLLKKNKIKPKSKGMMTEMMSTMGINMNVMKDNSDSKMAEMIMQGLTMGIVEMEKKIKDYENEVDKDIIKLAKKVLKFQEKSIEEIKEYL